MALLTWMVFCHIKQIQNQKAEIALNVLFMIAMMIVGHFGDVLKTDPVAFVWMALFLSQMMNLHHTTDTAVASTLWIHRIPLIAWVWVQILLNWIFRGGIMSLLSLLILAAFGPVSWSLFFVIWIMLLPLTLYAALISQMMSRGGALPFIWLLPLLTPLLIFGLAIVKNTVSETLAFQDATVYGTIYILFSIAVVPWAVAWMMKERITS